MLPKQDVNVALCGCREEEVGAQQALCNCNSRTVFDGLAFSFVWRALPPLVLRKVSVCAALLWRVMLRGEVTRAKRASGPAVPAGSSCP